MNGLESQRSKRGLRFRLFGVPVRIDGLFLIVAAVIGSVVGGNAGLVVGAGAVLLIVLAHELGHAAAEQVFGLRPSIELVWFGGLTEAAGVDELSRVRRIVVVAAGPAAGALTGGVAWWLGRDHGGMAGRTAALALLIGVYWGLANLAPVLPLDGGLLLVDLLRGTYEARLRRARMVSVAVATLLTVVAFALDQPVLALAAVWFGWVNLAGLRASPAKHRAAETLRVALADLSGATAAEAEVLAREAIDGKPPESITPGAAELLLAALLVRSDHHGARAALTTPAMKCVWPPFRDLAVLGPGAGCELDRRISEAPTGHDVQLRAVHDSLLGGHERVADLVRSHEGLDQDTLAWLQTRAFHAGRFHASIVIGEVAEGRPDVPSHVPYNVACGWARLGEAGAALTALERAAVAGYNDVAYLDADPDLDPLRKLDEYAAIRHRMATGHPARRPRAGRGRWSALPGIAACVALLAGLVHVAPGYPAPKSRSELVAVDLRSGTVRWRVPVASPYASVSSAGGLVVVNLFEPARNVRTRGTMSVRDLIDGREITSAVGLGAAARDLYRGHLITTDMSAGDGRLRAIDLASGDERWSVPTGIVESVRVIGAVGIVAGADSPALLAVDLETGAELWSRDDVYTMSDSTGDALLVSSGNAHLIAALDPVTGTERWSAVVDGRAEVLGDHLWVDASAGERVLIDLESGERTTLPMEDVTSEPLLEVEGTAVLRVAGGIGAIDLPTGTERWRHTSTTREIGAVAASGRVITWSREAVTAYIAESGQVSWTVPGQVFHVDAAGSTVVLRASGRLQALDAETGRTLWNIETGRPVSTAEVIGDTVVYNAPSGTADKRI